MKSKKITSVFIVLVSIILTFIFSISTSALDNKYYITDLGLTVKLPKQYFVVTTDSQMGDKNFSSMGLDYDETIIAFNAANIYLQAQDDEFKLKITLTKTQDEDSEAVNNYSSLGDDELKTLLSTYLEDKTYYDGSIKKHGQFSCIDLRGQKTSDGKDIYIYQINTVVNGMNLNFTIQKETDPLEASEEKVLSNMVNSMAFDKIIGNNPSFEWWRILIWVLIMAVIVFAIYFVYHQYNEQNKKKRRQQQRRKMTRPIIDPLIPSKPEYYEKAIEDTMRFDSLQEEEVEETQEELSFDEVLGYQEKEEFKDRSLTDLETYDISVKNRNTTKGIEYFEDNGESFLKNEDYFDRYFKEQLPSRKQREKVASAIGTYTKISFRHLGYFFKNLVKRILSLFNISTKND